MSRVTFTALTLVWSQAPEGQAEFDVVSIKRNVSGDAGTFFDMAPGTTFSMVNGRVVTLIREAYPVQNDDIPGVPDWTRRERYDVIAKVNGSPTHAQIRTMLRAMLADRFKLVVHIEQRELPVYALALAKPDRGLPSALRSTKMDCESADRAAPTRTPLPDASNGAPGCAYRQVGGSFNAGGVTMAAFAAALGATGFADRIVIDQTGLTGRYEFTLHAANTPTRGPQPPADDAPTLSTALREQLGLKLDPQRTRVETLVIDRVERPEAN